MMHLGNGDMENWIADGFLSKVWKLNKFGIIQLSCVGSVDGTCVSAAVTQFPILQNNAMTSYIIGNCSDSLCLLLTRLSSTVESRLHHRCELGISVNVGSDSCGESESSHGVQCICTSYKLRKWLASEKRWMKTALACPSVLVAEKWRNACDWKVTSIGLWKEVKKAALVGLWSYMPLQSGT